MAGRRGVHFTIFKPPGLVFPAVAASLSALVVCLLIRVMVRRTTTETERQNMVVFALAHRSWRQWILKVVVVLPGSAAEEAPYRGVGWQILSYSTGQYQAAALLCSAAFALAHWIQGWKSMLFIFTLCGDHAHTCLVHAIACSRHDGPCGF